MTNAQFRERFEAMVTNIGRVIKGKDDVIRLALTALIANGHVLFEDMPGTGKTMLARAISQTINATQTRVQCTPDLLPGDITGSPVLDRKTGDFAFRQGPVFANVFLADEINRATPKTQSALLEAMAERRVTVDGVTHDLPRPFFVLATENPVELAGTFALPEAQLDRFLFKLSVGYADRDAEVDVIMSSGLRDPIDELKAIIDIEDVVEMIDWASGVTVSEAVAFYLVDLVQATRVDPALQIGASTRASQSFLRASRVVAAAQGREDVLPDDVKNLAVPILGHRLMLTPDALLRDETVEAVIERILNRVKAPLGLTGKSARRSA
ncbi:MAG: MoxR family ATPase [Frankiales bacterium]|nr:MoxR family ATPase [Frankiales bacterium]